MPRIRVKKPAECPSCGHAPFSEIGWGYPVHSVELGRDLESGRVVLGGCVVSGDDPVWACSECGTQMWSDGRIRPGGDGRTSRRRE